ncbi:MAG: hypothetical protein K0Q97_2869 [Bacillota bacterium]|jgi:environmental stress-induced protein Ves|nr:hypothetical protein [Bacillota bacterium]
MKIKLIKDNDVKTSIWAGGESRQYYIFPTDSSYAERNFCFRVSMATSTSDEEAKYTSLENITRHLIMLEGSAHLFHKNHYDILMNPYEEIDVFDGGWESWAIGKVTDFNLMLSNNAHGKMAVVLNDGDYALGGICKNCNKKYNRTAFYCGQGRADIYLSTGEFVSISKGDLLLIEDINIDANAKILLFDSKLVSMDICCY